MLKDVKEIEQDIYVIRIYLTVKTQKYFATIVHNAIRIFITGECCSKRVALLTATDKLDELVKN